MSTYYEIKADIDGSTEILFGSYDKSDCTYELSAERDGWKGEGYKKFKVVSREVTEKPDAEIYGDDIDPNTGEIKAEINEEDGDDCEEEFTEEEEEALEQAKSEGYNVEGELARLYLDMDYANSFMLMKTNNMSMPFQHPSYKAAKVAYRAYWDAVDGE